jgi:5-methyltetrahydropteroyltriglutamate--homocysteine methyltransferase
MTTPPFRAEHVGSLLRPEKLRAARAEAEGDIYRTATAPLRDPGLTAIEDEAVREAVRLQEDVGLEVITDGEYRRRSWFQDFLLSLTGTQITWVDAERTVSAALPFQDDTTVDKLPGHIIEVKSKLKREGGIFTEHYRFLRSATKRTPKISLPSPTQLHFWGGRDCIDKSVYRRLGRRDQGSACPRLPLCADRRRDISDPVRPARASGDPRPRRRSG